MQYCVIIPHYRHHALIDKVLTKLIRHELPMIIVDDGSDEQSLLALNDILKNYDNCTLEKNNTNLGKGHAVIVGLQKAGERGCTHAFQIDADGQHNIDDLEAFLDLSKSNPESIISGLPIFDDDIPAIRIIGKRLNLYLTRISSFSLQIKDDMCGYRVYPVEAVIKLSKKYFIGRRMDFDTELLVKWTWTDGVIDYVPTPIKYPTDGISHYRYFRDNINMVVMHLRLLVGMLIRLPYFICKKFSSTLPIKKML